MLECSNCKHCDMTKEPLQDKIDKLEFEIKHIEEQLLSDIMKSLLPNKCEYCGCCDGIHRIDCSFIRRYC